MEVIQYLCGNLIVSNSCLFVSVTLFHIWDISRLVINRKREQFTIREIKKVTKKELDVGKEDEDDKLVNELEELTNTADKEASCDTTC